MTGWLLLLDSLICGLPAQVRFLVKSISYDDRRVSSAEASCTTRSITSWAEGMS